MPNHLPERLGAALRALREDRGLTQDAAGARVGMSEASASRYESGTAKHGQPLRLLADYASGLEAGLRVLVVPGAEDHEAVLLHDARGRGVPAAAVLDACLQALPQLDDTARWRLLDFLEWSVGEVARRAEREPAGEGHDLP